MRIALRPEDGVPVYRQIADEIIRSVRSGALSDGEKLPTVRELAEALGVSCGTVKHAYGHLESAGVLDMSRGRGTFVRAPLPAGGASKKERVLSAIDALLSEMEALSFSPQEMRIYFDLKLRERMEEAHLVRVTAVASGVSELLALSQALEACDGVRVSRLLLDEALRSPQRADDGADAVVCTDAAESALLRCVRERKKLVALSLETRAETVAELARLGADAPALALYADEAERAAIESDAALYCAAAPVLTADALDAAAAGRALASAKAIIVSDAARALCGAETAALLESFPGAAVGYRRGPDRGSTRALFAALDGARARLADPKTTLDD